MVMFLRFRRIALPAVAASISLLRAKPSCTANSDEETFRKLMDSAGVPPSYFPELDEAGVGTVPYLMCIGEGKLCLDPPDGPTLHAILQAARAETKLVSPNMMPKRDGSEHGNSGATTAAEAQSAYARLHSQMTLLCRLAKAALPGIVSAKAHVASSPSEAAERKEKAERERELEEAKHPTAKATALRNASYQLYNVHLGISRHERRAADDQLVKTHQSLKLHRLSVAALNSAKYGRLTAIDRPQTTLTVSESTLIASEEHHSLGRYSETLQCINACIDSLVEGGLIEISPAMQPLAAESPHGKLRDGRQIEFDLQAGLALKSAYLALSDCLNGKALAAHWAEHFVAAAANDMHGGHSLASSTMNLMSSSAMRPSEHLAINLGLATVAPKQSNASDVPSVGGASSSTSLATSNAEMAKKDKRIAQLEREREEMIRAKHRRLSSPGKGKGGYHDYGRSGYDNRGSEYNQPRGGNDRDTRDGHRRN